MALLRRAVGSAIGDADGGSLGTASRPSFGASLITVVLGIIISHGQLDTLLLPDLRRVRAGRCRSMCWWAAAVRIYIPELFPNPRCGCAPPASSTPLGPRSLTNRSTPFLVVMLFESRGVAGVMSLIDRAAGGADHHRVRASGIEPRHRSLEELKADDAAPAVWKEAVVTSGGNEVSPTLQPRTQVSALSHRERVGVRGYGPSIVRCPPHPGLLRNPTSPRRGEVENGPPTDSIKSYQS